MSTPDEDLAAELRDVVAKLGGLADQFHSFGAEVNEHLTTATRDLRQHAGWISEAAPLLDQLAVGYQAHAKRLEHDSATLLELTEHVTVLLEEMPRQPKYPPICWVRLTAAEADKTWTTLGEWVDTLLVGRYFVDRDHLPDCWPLHPGAVEEVTWLYTAWQHAYLKTAGAVPAAEWHVRWRPNALNNVADAVAREVTTTRGVKCVPGRHLGVPLPGADADDPSPEPAQPAPAPALAHAAAAPASAPPPWAATPQHADSNGRPSPPPRPADPEEYRRKLGSELAERRFWWPQLLAAQAADVARRREIEAAAAAAESAADQPDTGHQDGPPDQ